VNAVERAEWLEWRRAGIGASDVAAQVGLSQWAEPLTVWLDKMSLLDDDEPSFRQQSGIDLEPVLATWFERATGLYAMHPQRRVEHPDWPVARATLDADVIDAGYDEADGDHLVGVVDWKTEGGYGRKWDEIPLHYQCQGQWQMYVTGTERMWFGVLHGLYAFEVYELARDDQDIATLRAAAERFWTDHVVAGIPPAPVGTVRELQALARAFPDHEPHAGVQVDAGVIAEWRNARSIRKKWQTIENVHKAQIMLELGEAEIGYVGEQVAVTWRTTRPKKVRDLEAAWQRLGPHQQQELTTVGATQRRLLDKGQPDDNDQR